MKSLETKRMILRALSLEDLEEFNRYAKKPHIGPMAGWAPHTSLEESRAILNMMIKENEVWGITVKPSPKIVGTIGLHVRNFHNAVLNQKEVGYVIDDVFWGQGLMVEAVKAVLDYAFFELELTKVLCGHAKNNLQSKRVIEKCGFTPTGIDLRDHFDGTKIEILMYEMTINQYKELTP
jgi:RimJ/RimL family protein N-acetyltransferase